MIGNFSMTVTCTSFALIKDISMSHGIISFPSTVVTSHISQCMLRRRRAFIRASRSFRPGVTCTEVLCLLGRNARNRCLGFSSSPATEQSPIPTPLSTPVLGSVLSGSSSGTRQSGSPPCSSWMRSSRSASLLFNSWSFEVSSWYSAKYIGGGSSGFANLTLSRASMLFRVTVMICGDVGDGLIEILNTKMVSRSKSLHLIAIIGQIK